MISLMVGLPIGARGQASFATNRGGELFPCQDSPCGCANATLCWDKCCCYTDAEKMDWATRNAIQPPAFFVARMLKLAARLDRDRELLAASPAPSSVTGGIAQTRPCCAGSNPKSLNAPLLTFDSVNRCNGFKVVLKLLTESWVERKPLVAEQFAPWLLFRSLHDDEWLVCVALPIDPPIPDCRID